MRGNLLKDTVKLMIEEEWRLHTTLFRGRRFIGFPIILFLLTLSGVLGLLLFGISQQTLRGGVLLVAALIGFQTGSAGFEGQEAIRNLLGEVTLVLYSSRTLPISKSLTLTSFFIKEVVYYTGLFLLPLVSGAIVGITLIESSLSPKIILETFLLSISSFVAGVSVAFLLAEGAILGGRLTTREADDTVSPKAFRKLIHALGNHPRSAVATKSLLDVQRSSGGVGKLLFSSSALLIVAYVVVSITTQWINTTPSFSVVFGTLLSATAFPTYAWLTRIDDVEDYRLYPVSATCLRDGKALAFAVLEVPLLLVYFIVLSVLTQPTILDLLRGMGVIIGTTMFVFGLTIALTEFKPSEYLFDGSRFTLYSGALTVGYLPLLMAGLFFPLDGGPLTTMVMAYAVLLSLIGASAYFLTRPSNQLKPE